MVTGKEGEKKTKKKQRAKSEREILYLDGMPYKRIALGPGETLEASRANHNLSRDNCVFYMIITICYMIIAICHMIIAIWGFLSWGDRPYTHIRDNALTALKSHY